LVETERRFIGALWGTEMTNRKTILLACVSVLALSGAVHAQPVSKIEEIVVTAKQREESLQDVPLAITAFSALDIEKRSILDVRDLARFTPSFNYYSGTGRGDPTALVVRGLAANTSDERFQGLSIFVDGIFQSGQLTSIDLSSLERVEVLRGPQSATFGRATYSGAIDYVTRDPSTTNMEGRARVLLSTEGSDNFNHIASLRVSLPVIEDKLAIALNGAWTVKDGLTANPSIAGTSAGGDIGQEKTKAFGVTVFAQPFDTATLKLRFAYDGDRDTAALVHVIEPEEWAAAGSQTITTPGGQIWIGGAVPSPRQGATGGGEFLPNARPTEAGRDRNRFFTSAIYEQDLDWATLSYRGGYFFEHYYANADFNYRPAQNDIFFGNRTNRKLRRILGTATPADLASIAGNNLANDEEFENHSHQLRLVSNGDDALRWKAGLYYFKESDRNFQIPTRTATNPTGQSRGFETAENYAGFAGLDYDVTDALTVSAEGRLESEKKAWKECTFCATNNRGAGVDDKRTFFSPRITANYKASPDNIVYALWSRGWKGARINTVVQPNAAVPGSFIALLPAAKPERLDNYELGSKNTLLDGRAVLNVSAFYNKVKNQQAFFPLENPRPPPLTLTGAGNFGNSRIYGGEVEGSIVATEGLRLSGGLGLADHKFTQAVAPLNDIPFFPTGGTVKGKRSINTPKWTASGSVEYTALVADYEATARADFAWRDKMFVDRANLAWVKSKGTVNLRASLADEEIGWTLSAFVKDVFDAKTADGAGLSGSSACYFDTRTNARCLFLAIPRGREIGVDAVYNF
jgi:iron complex outermembrane recepter protein